MKNKNEVHSPEEAEALNSDVELSSRRKYGSLKTLAFFITLLFVSILLNIVLVVNYVRKIDVRQDLSPYGNALFPSFPNRTIFFSVEILTYTYSLLASRCANQVQLSVGLWPRKHH